MADSHTFTWDFGDGSPAATGQTVAHSYADNDIYSVTLTVTDDDGGNGASTANAVVANVAPTAGAGGPYSGEVDTAITFAATVTDPGSADTHTFTWDFGDDSPTATGQSVSHVYGATGPYSAAVTATDDDGGSGIGTASVIVSPPNQAPAADAGLNQTVTDIDGSGGETVALDGSGSSDPDGSISSYEWTEGATTLGSGSTPNVELEAGTHTITLTVTDNVGATDSDTVEVTVNRLPTASAGTDQSVNDTDGNGAETITLDGSASSDPDGTIVSYK